VATKAGSSAASAWATSPVRFRFTPLLGSWQIDDVYVDPFKMR
jgi:hypothetical protein